MIQKHSGFLSSLEAKVWSERGLDRRSPAKERKGRMQGKSTKAVGEASRSSFVVSPIAALQIRVVTEAR